MGRKKMPGLFLRNGVWHIDKQVKGIGRIRESTGTSLLSEAEVVLTRKLAVMHQQKIYGIQAVRSFRSAATKYLKESTKKSLRRDADCLKKLDPFIGDLAIESVHMGSLQAFIDNSRQLSVKSATVKRELAVVRQILNLASGVWRDENDKPWLMGVPKIVMPDWRDSAQAYPLNWDEQATLFNLLPAYLANMALFKVNTGLREQEVCWLRWDWEIKIPEINANIFLIPGRSQQYSDGLWLGTKNGEDQVVVLNKISRSVIKGQRGKHADYVFHINGHRVNNINTSAWKTAWVTAGLPNNGRYTKGVHNLKHTFGRRLRAVGVPLETRKVLLHHTNGDITSHYSAAEIEELIEAAERVVGENPHKSPTMTLIKNKVASSSG
ncbi:MAG: hypothetical protein A6F70_03930 [Cycloclasticus sp. symbiont of Bathymodiolus heckerae]|nr:MAG: hypothetical protein A6F70_03930 [Cycloclasticus sp. symbiont of Bathymodiolus heckerae]